MSLLEMMGLDPKLFDFPLLKMIVRRLLLVLDFLRTEAEIIHADTLLFFVILQKTH